MQQLAGIVWLIALVGYQKVDTARNGAAGRLVEQANSQSGCLQLDSGRSLDQIIRDFYPKWISSGKKAFKVITQNRREM